jgi:hypothetical protein
MTFFATVKILENTHIARQVEMIEWFNGKKVAIVGNATSLFEQSYGKDIDSHDVVVRINRAAPICFLKNKREMKKTQGLRTDVWAFSFADTMKIELDEYHSVCDKLIQMNDQKKNKIEHNFHFECMSGDDIKVLIKSLNDMKKDMDKNFIREEMKKINYDEKFRHIKKHRAYLLQDIMQQDLLKRLNMQLSANKTFVPSTGLRVLEYISKCDPLLVNVYGFDWKETPTFYDKKSLTRLTEEKHNHNYFLERDYCKKVYKEQFGYGFILNGGALL